MTNNSSANNFSSKMESDSCVHCFGSLLDGKTSTISKNTEGILMYKVFELTNIQLEIGFLCNPCLEIVKDIEKLQLKFISRTKEDEEVCETNPEPEVYVEEFQPLESHETNNNDESDSESNYLDLDFEQKLDPFDITNIKHEDMECEINEPSEINDSKKDVKKNVKHRCSECKDRTFSTKIKLLDHLRTHDGKEVCDVCDKIYKNPKTLSEHKKVMHKEANERPYTCNVCPKGFFVKAKLTDHMNTHTGIKPYGCKFCEKKFTTAAIMRRHQNENHFGKPRQRVIN